ncbi:glycoprotein-N-acetylgalactosamine 3-beta-galactosyltransferase 1-like [Eupeodes corollae]|uniref:glycoprotein-N-acetylgalactosamine 3-beta-galactosyltransferase 1-like n=1 Tax=Eupeodes corollae TaxID=290404 RepID=UPI002491BA31|nr:glycoprotein-N-acetylgalactosamine 3-beta-galactosyltransferase 1-like [Eupeodes corollae]
MKTLTVFMFGMILGFCLSQLLHMTSWTPNYCDDDSLDVIALRRRNLRARYEEDEDDLTEIMSNNLVVVAAPNHDGIPSHKTIINANNNNKKNSIENISLATRLYNETRVLCWILTGPANHMKRAIHIKKTWGSRCNKLLFMSSAEDEELGTIKLPVGEGRKNLWFKTREAFKYIWDNHRNDADWFLKADDDTYVIAENLRAFLYPYSTDSPVYFGCKFKPHVRQGYMSGGAGYVLSREALRRFVELAYPNKTICRQNHGGSEDMEMGYCLQNVGVVAGDSRDEDKRGRFFPSGPQSHIIARDKSHWYWRYIFYATDDGLNCCSDHAISFHYIHPDTFYMLDYLIYKLRPFGVIYKTDKLVPKHLDMNKFLDKWRNETSENTL